MGFSRLGSPASGRLEGCKLCWMWDEEEKKRGSGVEIPRSLYLSRVSPLLTSSSNEMGQISLCCDFLPARMLVATSQTCFQQPKLGCFAAMLAGRRMDVRLRSMQVSECVSAGIDRRGVSVASVLGASSALAALAYSQDGLYIAAASISSCEGVAVTIVAVGFEASQAMKAGEPPLRAHSLL